MINRWARWGLFTVAIWLVSVRAGTGQVARFGLTPTPRVDYDALSKYDPSVVRVRKILSDGKEVFEQKTFTRAALPSKFDLTDFLPKPGQQSFGDCTAWSVAHGAYSYQLGRSRGRKPSQPYDQFSPRFIYSQINGGVDKGSWIFSTSGPSAVSLLSAGGCASEASCPYDSNSGGWHSLPSAQSKVEAKNFTLIVHQQIADIQGIKEAIVQNVPVVIAIYCDAKFMDFHDTSIYSAWDGVHANAHAICVVGYDDSKSAFKLMNSWSDSWKNDGFCWVSYSMFNIAPSNWCYEAHLIRVVDENPPFGVNADGVNYILDADGSVTKNGAALHAPGYGSKITATTQWPYILRPNGTVFTLRNGQWKDITSPNLPEGLSGQQVSMFAATKSFLYILTPTGRVYARTPGNSPSWDRLDSGLPTGEYVIDLRMNNGSIVITTKSGRIFKRTPPNWTEQS